MRLEEAVAYNATGNCNTMHARAGIRCCAEWQRVTAPIRRQSCIKYATSKYQYKYQYWV